MPVPELDILIATARWLWLHRGAVPRRVSISNGSAAERWSDRDKLRRAFTECGIPNGWSEAPHGPDIIAVSPTEIWDVECKGEGIGVPATQRNNFDRALASVVSYYEGGPYNIDSLSENAIRHLCLALPRTANYCKQLRRRVRRSLRERLSLWIFFYNSETISRCRAAERRVSFMSAGEVLSDNCINRRAASEFLMVPRVFRAAPSYA